MCDREDLNYDHQRLGFSLRPLHFGDLIETGVSISGSYKVQVYPYFVQHRCVLANSVKLLTILYSKSMIFLEENTFIYQQQVAASKMRVLVYRYRYDINFTISRNTEQQKK